MKQPAPRSLVVAACALCLLLLLSPLALAVLTVAVFARPAPCGPLEAVTGLPGSSGSSGADLPGGKGLSVAQANLKTTLSAAAFIQDLDRTVASGPDLVSLNEVAHRSARALERPGYDTWREPDAAVRGDDGTAVMWRTDRWEPIDRGRVVLVAHGPQRWDHDRAATWVTLQGVTASGTTAEPVAGLGMVTGRGAAGVTTATGAAPVRPVSMISVHQMINPARYGPDRSERQRLYRTGMERLAALVAILSSRGPVVVAGDFNSQYRDDDPWGPRRVLSTVAMSSSMDALGVRDTHDGGGTIDYIFYPAAVMAPLSQQVNDLNSDHHLLLTRFIEAPGTVSAATSDRRRLPPARSATTTDGPRTPIDEPDEGSAGGGPPAPPAPPGAPSGITTRQLSRARAIVETGAAMGVPADAIVIALAVARQESGYRIYANDGRGADLEPGQAGIEQSLALPHDAVGTDHGSLGLFQQQWPWWGTMDELMDPSTSARLFYQALLATPGWQQMPPHIAAQAVQRSGHPDAYADDLQAARELYLQLSRTPAGSSGADAPSALGADLVGSDPADTGAGPCADTTAGAGWGTASGTASTSTVGSTSGPDAVFPVAAEAGAVDLHNWGGGGPHWSSWHTGTDLSVACGARVLAAHTGTVSIDTTQAWAGPRLVKVASGPGELTTWYAHMQQVDVTDGQSVLAGQVLGEVGDLGNATGCHLHFEVHLRGGRIYGPDNVDPSAWLARLGLEPRS